MPTLESFLNHPIETLEKALHIRKQIAALEEGLKSLFGPTPISLAGVQTAGSKKRGRPSKASLTAVDSAGAGHGKKKRTMSAAAKAKIANAQRLRWAKSKGLESATLAGPVEAAPATKTKRKKGKMSAEGRARIVAAQKERWAKVKQVKK